jgi:plastocyanin
MKKSSICAALMILPLLLACERRSPVTTQTDSPPEAASPGVIKVVMRNMQFFPATVEIKKGDVIEWKNDDIAPHTATSSSFGDSGSLGSGQSWRHTFMETGNLPYACTFHPAMKGVVIVK